MLLNVLMFFIIACRNCYACLFLSAYSSPSWKLNNCFQNYNYGIRSPWISAELNFVLIIIAPLCWQVKKISDCSFTASRPGTVTNIQTNLVHEWWRRGVSKVKISSCWHELDTPFTHITFHLSSLFYDLLIIANSLLIIIVATGYKIL